MQKEEYGVAVAVYKVSLKKQILQENREAIQTTKKEKPPASIIDLCSDDEKPIVADVREFEVYEGIKVTSTRALRKTQSMVQQNCQKKNKNY